ncbi:uncharacterized protein LOC129953745 [Eupeodes corollae]|uniref:uncharacterized protein LOC129953745 n=1 Tax=Eupeodes corollae TaxID=290404 RepID=UPI00248FF95F|nr:uncharacterized protein LOC129953745 [Eupeodes corollae]
MVFEKRLIELVKERKCLYQTKSRSNANNRDRLSQWHRVSAALRKPVNECRQRWRSLRDRFVREKKKLELGDTSSNHEQLWEYYNDLMFLIPSVKPRRSKRDRSFQNVAKIYLNRELSDNFVNISNSRDEGELTEPCESYASDEMFDTETTMAQEFNDESKTKESIEECMLDNSENYEEQHFSTNRNESAAFQQAKEEEEWIDDDFDKYPIIKLPTSLSSNENQNNVYKNTQNNLFSLGQTAAVEATTAIAADPTSSFVELIKTLNSEIGKVLVEEKDENDLFLECMAKKMKKLSPRAKFKIQAKLLENITEELLKEFPE